MFRLKTILISAVFATVYSIPSYAINLGQLVDSATKALASEEKGSATVSEHTISNPDDVRIAIGFSPEGSAQTAIIEMIDSSKSQIRLAAYSFTSPRCMKLCFFFVISLSYDDFVVAGNNQRFFIQKLRVQNYHSST